MKPSALIAAIGNHQLVVNLESRPRKHLGFLEEYWIRNGRNWQYAGNLAVEVAEHPQATGSENAIIFTLDADLEIKRSFSKMRMLKKGTEVRRMVHPLQGREV